MEDYCLDLRVVLLGEDHLLRRIHAADRGAVRTASLLVPGPDALDPGNPMGDRAVGGTEQITAIGARGADEPFELDTGDHVREPVVPVKALGGRIERFVPRGQDKASHLKGRPLHLLVKIDGLALTGGHADLTFLPVEEEAAGRVDNRHGRHCLGEVDVNALLSRQVRVVHVRDVDGAVLGAGAAPRALLLIHVPGLLDETDLEAARLPFYRLDPGVGHDRDVGVLSAFDEFRGKDAHGAIVRGEGLIQLGHPAPDSRAPVHEIYPEP